MAGGAYTHFATALDGGVCLPGIAGGSEAKKSELEGVISRLTSKIDLAAAKSAGLKDDVKTLQAELATLSREQAEMDSIRAEEKAASQK